MTTDIAEVLRAGAPIPRRDVNLEAIEARLRRRRLQWALVGVLVAGIVIATGTAVALIARDRTEAPRIATEAPRSSHVGGAVTGHSEQGAISITPPDNWHALAPGTNPGPSEILTVATTAARPTPGVITACPANLPSGPAAYISIYEYQPGSPLITPTNESFNEAAFQPRAQHIDPARALGGECADPSTGAMSNHFRMLPLTENGRRFLIRVVTTGDPDAELLAATGPILDTLRIGN